MPRPSPTNETPISNKNDNASIFIVGWRLMKELMGSAENIMTPTAKITAAIMMLIWLAMPTAVMTESNEKTISSTAI
jgi:hypothetical protein